MYLIYIPLFLELEFDLSSVEKILNEFQEKVIQLEEESQLVKRQEYEKEEKLARANCTVKKLLKNLERQKIENYEVIKWNLFPLLLC